MPKKTKIIFISVFVIVGMIILSFYLYNKSKNVIPGDSKPSLYDKFNPFKPNTPTNVDGDPNDPTIIPSTDPVVKNKKLKKLTDFAVAGAVFFEEEKIIKKEGEVNPTSEIIPSLRYVERATGHVYQMNLSNNTIGKISNSTIPNVYETIFDGTGNSVIYRYVSTGDKTITSFLATLGGKSDFLNSDILDISISPKKDKYFSIIKNKNGVTGVTKSFEGTNTNQVFTSSFTEWLPEWVGEQSVYLTTKPSYLVEGNVFNLNTTNGTLTKIFGGVPGLTTLSNKDGTSLLYGASLEKGPKLNIFNIKNHTSADLNLYGLPEKCIWSKDNINIYCGTPSTITGIQYPDSWYQGITSFDDYFTKINSDTKDASTITNIGDSESIDAIKLFLSNKEDKLFFINKNDYTLWSLDL